MQVYMASMFENQYKLLARAGNKVQEVKSRYFKSVTICRLKDQNRCVLNFGMI